MWACYDDGLKQYKTKCDACRPDSKRLVILPKPPFAALSLWLNWWGDRASLIHGWSLSLCLLVGVVWSEEEIQTTKPWVMCNWWGMSRWRGKWNWRGKSTWWVKSNWWGMSNCGCCLSREETKLFTSSDPQPFFQIEREHFERDMIV